MSQQIKIIYEGLQELDKDNRDFQLGTIIKWPKLEELPTEYLVRPLSIKNQIVDGNDDFCASCAGAGMIEPKEEIELFYPYLFAAAKHESGKNVDSWGLTLRDVGKALVKWGVPEIKDVPDYVKNLSPEARRDFKNYPNELRQLALNHRAASYFFIDGPYDPYDNARASLHYFRNKKQQIMFGVKFGWFITDFVLDGTPNGFGHALYSCGFYPDGIVAINSAGEEAGQDGRHSITRKTFNHYAGKYGMMMISDMPKETVKYHIENNIKVDDNWLLSFLKMLLCTRKNKSK